jgi:AcrR family transcriptional regulator
VRRDQIARAVLALTADRGVGGINVAAVARRVGVAPSALYRHYASKDAMLAATIERIGARMLANVERARSGSPDPLVALERLLMLQVDLVRQNRGIPFLLFGDGVQRSPGHRRRLLRFLSSFRSALVDLFAEAKRRGRVRAGLDPAALAVQFIGLYVPSAILWNVTRGRFDMKVQAHRAWTVFHEGICVRARTTTRGRRRFPGEGDAGTGARAGTPAARRRLPRSGAKENHR